MPQLKSCPSCKIIKYKNDFKNTHCGLCPKCFYSLIPLVTKNREILEEIFDKESYYAGYLICCNCAKHTNGISSFCEDCIKTFIIPNIDKIKKLDKLLKL
jgi:hypothetical protein